MDFTFIKEFENREGLKSYFKDFWSVKLPLDALSSIVYFAD